MPLLFFVFVFLYDIRQKCMVNNDNHSFLLCSARKDDIMFFSTFFMSDNVYAWLPFPRVLLLLLWLLKLLLLLLWLLWLFCFVSIVHLYQETLLLTMLITAFFCKFVFSFYFPMLTMTFVNSLTLLFLFWLTQLNYCKKCLGLAYLYVSRCPSLLLLVTLCCLSRWLEL